MAKALSTYPCLVQVINAQVDVLDLLFGLVVFFICRVAGHIALAQPVQPLAFRHLVKLVRVFAAQFLEDGPHGLAHVQTDVAAEVDAAHLCASLLHEPGRGVTHQTGIQMSGVQYLERIRVRIFGYYHLAFQRAGGLGFQNLH